jgi:GWxTD domain-containing protein
MISSVVGVLLALVSAIEFSVDWAAFRAGPDSCRVEFFYGIPYDQLLYTQSDSGIGALFSVEMDMTGIDTDFREHGVIQKRARLSSFQEAERRQRSFVDGFSVVAPAGRYRFRIAVAESAAGGLNRGVREDTILVSGMDHGLVLSSLQLGSSVVADTSSGAVSVIPNPRLRFGVAGNEAVYVYFEGYGLSQDSNRCRVDIAVLRPRSSMVETQPEKPGLSTASFDTLVRGGPVFRGKSGTRVASALGVSLESVEPGPCLLSLSLTDLATGQRVTQTKGFAVGAATVGTGFRVSLESLSGREQRYYREIEFIATSRELGYYAALSDSGKDAWLAWFWSQHNLTEYARRMEAAEEKYRHQRTPGVKTDRGRVYVKYGEPDAVEQKVIETDARSREYWHYYGSGYTFVFIDVRGDGNFRLAWTNSKEEPRTGYEDYLLPAEQEQFR